MKRYVGLICLLFAFMLKPAPVYPQDSPAELAATLEVLSPTVEVRRVNTVNWITVNVEAIVGVGDLIRTDETGRARITFFADGVDTELLPDTEYRIDRFEGEGDSFTLSASVLLGQSLQRIERLLDANSSYDIETPGMELTVRGTQFQVRVETGGRSAALVYDGTASASQQANTAEVPMGYGIRAAADGPLSDVVVASTFEELDAALDGCSVEVRTQDDVRLNVRIGPSLALPRAGTVAGAEIPKFMGVSESGNWYRIEFRGAFGWVLATDVTLDPGCAGLRVFPDTYQEDPTLYEELGDIISLDDLLVQSPTPTAEPTPESE
jgi:hypothetical protein